MAFAEIPITSFTLNVLIDLLYFKSSQVKSSAVVKNDQKLLADIFKVHVKIW